MVNHVYVYVAPEYLVTVERASTVSVGRSVAVTVLVLVGTLSTGVEPILVKHTTDGAALATAASSSKNSVANSSTVLIVSVLKNRKEAESSAVEVDEAC